jgi:hypothetical protein
VGSETLQISTAAPDFCFSRAQRLWDVICAIWDLLRCTEIWKSAVREFSAGKEISQQIFHLFFAALIFLMPKTANFSLLGSGICNLLSARSSIGTSEALASLAVSGTPCPHGLDCGP